MTSKSLARPRSTPATWRTVRSMIASSLYAGSTAEMLDEVRGLEAIVRVYPSRVAEAAESAVPTAAELRDHMMQAIARPGATMASVSGPVLDLTTLQGRLAFARERGAR